MTEDLINILGKRAGNGETETGIVIAPHDVTMNADS
jgi:hypothetical protein